MMPSGVQLPELSLYVHIPWCIQKCPYCDFNSHKLTGAIPEQAYVSRLLDDLEQDLEWAQERPLESIFIGGGTPSVMSAKAIARLLTGIRQRIPLAAEAEVTLEANPGTFETEKFADFVSAGVNRLSIGIQSLQQHQLSALGRIHDPHQAREAAAHANQLPLRSFNLDLMHGLPEQSLAAALDDLRQVIALEPPHISWYQLTIEPNTMFASKPPQLPDDDTLWDIYQAGHQLLQAAGYQQYEVSAYAKEGHQSVHNRNYWRFGDYLGIGCGAHSKITIADSGEMIRCEKVKHPQGYLDLTRPLRYQQQPIAHNDITFEFFMNHFRLLEPVTKQRFESTTGLPAKYATEQLHEAIEQGWVIDYPQHWQLTQQGHRYLNSVLTTLLD